MTPTPPDSILIIRMSALGDIVCALPVLRALRASFPRARIGWVVDERFHGLIADEPAIDDIIVAPFKRWRRMLANPLDWGRLRRDYQALARLLRSAEYDVCLDLQGIMKSGFISRIARCPRTLQMADDHLGKLRRFFPGERVPWISPHAVERMLPLAAAAGADVTNARFDFHIPEENREHANALLRRHEFGADGPIIALNPGAAAVHRLWPVESFAAAAKMLHADMNARVVVLGGPSEIDLAESIAQRADASALVTAGKTDFLQLAGVLELCDVVVSADTGPMHLAVGVGTPVVALFGPANPERTGPYGDQHIVIQKDIGCGHQPCYAHPPCKDYACMSAITPEEVVAAIGRILEMRG